MAMTITSRGHGSIGALFNSVTPPGQDKKRAKKSRGEKSVTEPMQQHGELPNSEAPKMPTVMQRTKMHAKDAKVSATRDWVEGRITTKEHKAAHARADHVLTNQKPNAFRGMSGERKMKL
jgi:hypothetical protein